MIEGTSNTGNSAPENTSLACASEHPEPFTISDFFMTSAPTLWMAWTRAEQLEWFGPRGASTLSHAMSLSPGGMYHYSLRLPDGGEIWGRWIFREIDPHSRLVFVSSFSDPAGQITRHPHSSHWPLEMVTTVTFAPERLAGRTGAHDRTLLTVEWLPEGATEEEWRTFDGGRDSMREGWGGTFERLHHYLTSRGEENGKRETPGASK